MSKIINIRTTCMAEYEDLMAIHHEYRRLRRERTFGDFDSLELYIFNANHRSYILDQIKLTPYRRKILGLDGPFDEGSTVADESTKVGVNGK